MNKKGFTLVELLAVLVIMAILMLIVVTPIMGQVRNNSSKLDEAALDVLYSSTESYLDNNTNSYNKSNGMIYYVSVGQLIDNGELKKSYLDSISEKKLTRSSTIRAAVKNGGYSYTLNENSSITNLDNAYNLMDNEGTYDFFNGKYASGTVNNNYVYYSGYTWRIMGKNKDGSIKLITDEDVSSLLFGETKYIEKSYVYEWLNNYFYNRLKFKDIIAKNPWCIIESTYSNNTTDPCSNLVTADNFKENVGLLSLYEYNLSVLNSNSYLRNSTGFGTGTLVQDAETVYYIASDGTVSSGPVKYGYHVRPVINVIPETPITSGSGTKNDPYIIVKVNSDVLDTSLLTLNDINLTSGEYISLDSNIYRVVDTDKKETKIILNDLLKSDSNYYSTAFGTTNTFDTETGIGYYLNTNIYASAYQDKVLNRFWYQGEMSSLSVNYKMSSLGKTNIIYNIRVGLPKYGEVMTAPIYGGTDNAYWTLSKYDASNLITINKEKGVSLVSTGSSYVRPVIIIDSAAKVGSGSGTINSPYVIKY